MDEQTTLFKQYENDYCNKSTDVSRKITAIESLSGETRRKKVQECEADLKEAENTIKRMDMEARSLPPEKLKPLQLKVKEYRADLAVLKEQLKKTAAATPAGDAARAELGLSKDYYSTSAGQRDRMLGAGQRLEKSGERLKQGKAMLVETEELGANILRDLESQRNVINHASDNLRGADDTLSRARNVLFRMSRRIWQNKIIMAGVAALLLVGIILIIYFKLK